MPVETIITDSTVQLTRISFGDGIFDSPIGLTHTEAWRSFNLESSQENENELLSVISTAERIIIDAGIYSFIKWQHYVSNSLLLTALQQHQSKVKILVPIATLNKLAFPGEIPHWQQLQYAQTEEILYWSGLLPESSIIFLKDLIEICPSPLMELLIQNIASKLVFVPQQEGGFIPGKNAINQVIKEIHSPNVGSVIIQSQAFNLVPMIQEAVSLYFAMFRRRIATQEIQVEKTELVPFQCRIVEVNLGRAAQVQLCTNQLSPPSEYEHHTQQLQDLLTRCPSPPLPQKKVTLAELKSKKSILNPSLELDAQDHAAGEQLSQKEVGEVNQQEFPTPSLTPDLSDHIKQDEDELLTADVKKIFRSSIETTHVVASQKKVVRRKKIIFKSKKRKTLFYLGVLFVVIGMGIAALLGLFQYSVRVADAELRRVIADSTITPSQARVSWGRFPTYASILAPQQALFSAIFSLPLTEEADQIINTGQALHTVENTSSIANQTMVAAFRAIWNPTLSAPSSQEIAAALTNHAEAMDTIATYIAGTEEGLQHTRASATQKGKSSTMHANLIPILPDFFGQKDTKTYAVVLQNSQELRPTGGFIEAVALLHFAGGSLTSSQAFSSYEIDTKIGGKVDPPEDLQTILGESNWWFRDANWSPSAAQSAQQIAWFLEKAFGEKPDGVIILNTSALPHLLTAIGPVEISEYDEVVTDKNIAERLEQHTELPQQISTNTAEYRSTLLNALLKKMSVLSDEQILALLPALNQELDNRQLVVNLFDPTLQTIFSGFGWSGSMAFPTCPEPFSQTQCQVDGLAQVETNVGVNRANAYIDRQMSHEIQLDAQTAHHTQITTWTNTAQTQAWPKGDYKVYVRMLVPKHATQIEAYLNGAQISAADIRKVSQDQGEEIGVVIIVPIAQTTTLKITYQIPVNLVDGSAYLFYQLRQPGVTSDLPNVSLNIPTTWVVESIAPEPETLPPNLTFIGPDAAQSAYIVQFAQVK